MSGGDRHGQGMQLTTARYEPNNAAPVDVHSPGPYRDMMEHTAREWLSCAP